MTTSSHAGVGAVLLVGGEGRRMGGIVKPLLTLEGRSLLGRTVDVLGDAGVTPIVAVGPLLDDAVDVVWTREEPPLGGPVAGIAAGIAQMSAEWVLILAGDLARPDAVVHGLLSHRVDDAAAPASVDGVVFSADGHPQWLAGLYRTASVRHALDRIETDRDSSVRALLGGLAIEWVADQEGITADIDSPADLARARQELEETP
ncbi:molybdenum cofactor guanylyltransferase [Microbacterium sp. NPDC055665]